MKALVFVILLSMLGVVLSDDYVLRVDRMDDNVNMINLTCIQFGTDKIVPQDFFHNGTLVAQNANNYAFTVNQSSGGFYSCGDSSQLDILPEPPSYENKTLSVPWGEFYPLDYCLYKSSYVNLEYQWNISSANLRLILQQTSTIFHINQTSHALSLVANPLVNSFNFKCEVDIKDDTNHFLNNRFYAAGPNINIKIEENNNNTPEINMTDKATVLSVDKDEVSFSCNARSLRSAKDIISFSIFGEQTEFHQLSERCNSLNGYTLLSCSNITRSDFKLNATCDFSAPYSVDCNFTVYNISKVRRLSPVRCSISGTNFEKTTGLVVRGEDQLPDIEIRQDDVDSRNITGTISFPFDITNIINRPLSLYIVLRQKTQIISMQQIQIQFKGNRIVQFRTFLNVSSPGIYNIRYKISFFGEDPETSNPITVNLTIPVTPSSTASTVSTTTSTTPPSTGPIEPVTLGSSIAAVVIIIVLAIVILFFILVILRTNRRKKEDISFPQRHPSQMENGKANHLKVQEDRSILNNSELSLLHSEATPTHSHTHEQPNNCSCSCHTRSSYSGHSHSSTNSYRSTTFLNQDPPTRYGYPDYQLSHSTSHPPPQTLEIGQVPQVYVQTPTPVAHNIPAIIPATPISPTHTEPFDSLPNSPTVPGSRDMCDYHRDRPTKLPIKEKKESSSALTPLSNDDNTMLTVMLYLQHPSCSKKHCGTCSMIKKQFEKIAEKYGKDTLDKAVKEIQTPGTEVHKQLRRKPKTPRTPSRLIPELKRQRSRSTSQVDYELTTETEDEVSLKKAHRRPSHKRTAVTDDEFEVDDDNIASGTTDVTLSLPLSKAACFSVPDLTPTPQVNVQSIPEHFFQGITPTNNPPSTLMSKQDSSDDNSEATDDSNTSSHGSYPINEILDKVDPEVSLVQPMNSALTLSARLNTYASTSSGYVTSSSSDYERAAPKNNTIHLTTVSSDNDYSDSDSNQSRSHSPTPLLSSSSTSLHKSHNNYYKQQQKGQQHSTVTNHHHDAMTSSLRNVNHSSPPLWSTQKHQQTRYYNNHSKYLSTSPDNTSIHSTKSLINNYQRRGSDQSSGGSNNSIHSEGALDFSSKYSNRYGSTTFTLPSNSSSATPL